MKLYKMLKQTVFNHYSFIKGLHVDRVTISIDLKAGINGDGQQLSWNQWQLSRQPLAPIHNI
ncbi:hypothetical protein [Kordiimonas sp. SCSIO 12610]|uniref:hypothetical protein n=1 Tax=Kordiimonas sp. SCSIO 12610 TaxID=2829597 RepID=UPI00210A9255|nr:hypothetical protein [Kordiimonas sp. SCSIO 12610]UTW54518.1 hypothetical protein KFF44_11980 [Kordiimonas sp. SCSIO 12610]